MKQSFLVRLGAVAFFLGFFLATALAQIRPLQSVHLALTAEHLPNTNTAYLLDWAQRDSLRYYAERDSAIRFARRYGYPVEGKFEHREYSLQGFDDAGLLHYYATGNAITAQAIKTDQVHPGGGAGLNLTGSGSVLGVWEINRPRATHVELTGRVTQIDNSFQSTGDHATHVSGTMVAAGIDPDARGMAYQANLVAWDINNDISEMAAAAADGLRLSNHSYGSISGWDYGDESGQTGWHWWGSTTVSQTTDFKFGQYDSKARSWDNIVRNAPFYLPVKSAGNDRNDAGPSPGSQHWVRNASGQWISSTTTRPSDGGTGGYDCIPTYGNAKNILTVGALDVEISGTSEITTMTSFTGWGPTDDGRIKPDIMAHGVGVYSPVATSNSSYDELSGTSMAAPAVTASLGLLLQHYQNLNPGYTLPASTLKTLVIHTADQTSGAGPNYRTGWGSMNTRAAADFITNLDAANPQSFLVWDTLYQNTPVQWQLGHGGGNMKITIVWTDPPGSVQGSVLNPTTTRLVNDLDVRLIRQSDNATFSPWRLDPASPASAATRGDNFRDNVEQIYEANLPEGAYSIRITHKGSLSGSLQTYSMLISVGNSSSSNTTCSQATAISCGQTVTGTTSGSTQNVPECDDNSLDTAPGIWYRYTADQTGTVTATTCNPSTNFDTKIGVFSGTCSGLVCVAANDDDESCSQNDLNSTVQFNAISGQSYYIYVTGYSTNSGTFQLSVTCGSGCQPPTDLAATSVGYAHIQIEANTVSGATGYQTRIRSAGGSWGEAPVYTSPLTIWGNLTPNAMYELQMRSECGAGVYSNWSPSVFATTLGAGEVYCYSYGLSWDHWIHRVSMNSISSISGNGYGYTNFTDQTTNVQAGNSYNITLTPQNSGTPQAVYWRVWIDFNKDNDFNDSGEQVFQTTGNSSTAATGSIAIPASASSGMTRMRVSMNIGSGYPTPCDNGNNRDVEDYSVNIDQSVQAPVANFSASITCGQAPLTVNFSDLSTNSPTSWSWSFGNNQTSSQQNPGTTYTQPGIYTVTLHATNTGGSDAEIKTALINVVAPVSLSASSNNACVGNPVSITATGASSYTWTGAGLSSTIGSQVTAQPAAPGNYTYTVIGSTSGCAASPVSTSLTFNPLPSAPTISSNGPTSLCLGQTATIAATNVCSGCTVMWSNGQSDSSITVSAAGIYTATTNNACGQSVASNAINLEFTSIPVLILNTSPVSPCAGESFTLTASGADTYLWSGPGLLSNVGSSIMAVPSAPGDYLYGVTGSMNGCTANQNITVHVSPANALAVSIEATGCPGPNLTFSSSVVNGGSASNTLWYRNGQAVWSGPVYTLFAAANGDEIYCEATPFNLPPCTQPAMAVSGTYVVNCINVVGTGEIEGLERATLMPNPNDGQFRLRLERSRPIKGYIRIFNALGQSFLAESIDLPEGDEVIPLQLLAPAAGFYWLIIQAEDGVRRIGFEVY